MDFDNVPDDIWIDIFEQVDDPQPLAALVRTCHRFRALARRPLLRELRWLKPRSTQRNIDAWNSVYLNAHNVPRKLTIGIPFEFASRAYTATTITPETRLHDAIWEHLPRFTALNELVLDGTTISVFSYTILTQMPALRSLSLINCTYIRLPTAFRTHTQLDLRTQTTTYPSSFPFSTLPITHLAIHAPLNQHSDPERFTFHPIRLATAANLSSLSITWTGSIALAYSESQTPPLHNLTELDVTMPTLTRDLVDVLVSLVTSCPLTPRIKLLIERHNLSDQQIGAVQVPLPNVCDYKGPLTLSSFGMTRNQIRNHGANAGLASVVMNDTVDLNGLLEGLERLPSGVQTLEVMVWSWDIEILFAIRELFKGITSLVIRYGKGEFSPDFFVTLGADILFDLPKLVTFKLFQDKSCVFVPPPRHHNNGHHPFNPIYVQAGYFEEELQPVLEDKPSEDTGTSGMEQADLNDYLIGWNRHCKKLRRVQLRESTWWERKFEGDIWREVTVKGDDTEDN